MFLNFVVIDPNLGGYLYWRDAEGNAFTRETAQAFADRHNALLAQHTPELDGNRLRVCELLPAGHRQRVCEASVEMSDAGFKGWANTVHDLAHEAA